VHAYLGKILHGFFPASSVAKLGAETTTNHRQPEDGLFVYLMVAAS